jgi:methionine-rich copper-binding protein CopC
MKKIMFIIMLLMLLPTTAFAHTGLESSSPKDKETITEPINEIVLTFNTNIEKLSTFSLLDKEGQKVNVDSVEVDGKLLKGAFKTLLPNGDYTVNWKIAGEDGHVIERSFTFTVTMPEKTIQAPQPTQPTESSQTESPPTPTEAKQQVEETISEQTPSNVKSNRSTFIWVGVSALVLIGIVGFTVGRRK